MRNKKLIYQCSLLVLTVLAFCMSACAENNGGKFVVHGKGASGLNKVLVGNLNMNKIVDTLQVANGEFTFESERTSGDVYYVFVDNNNSVVVVDDGNDVKLDMATHKAMGTSLNDKLSELADKINGLFEKYGELKKQYDLAKTEEEKKELTSKMSNLDEDFAAEILKVVDANQDNSLPAYLLTKVCEGMDFEKLEGYAESGAGYTKHPIFKYVKQYIDYKRPSMAFIGKKFTDVVGSDFNGKSHHLSEYVGKGNYVLVDFWASWCGPCMKEMPTLKACWEKYKAKGFNIVGISLDNDATKWKSAVDNGEYNWVHMSDLGGWKSAAASAYGVQSIPWNILCDGEGKIIAVSLRGNELDKKLTEIYK